MTILNYVSASGSVYMCRLLLGPEEGMRFPGQLSEVPCGFWGILLI